MYSCMYLNEPKISSKLVSVIFHLSQSNSFKFCCLTLNFLFNTDINYYDTYLNTVDKFISVASHQRSADVSRSMFFHQRACYNQHALFENSKY